MSNDRGLVAEDPSSGIHVADADERRIASSSAAASQQYEANVLVGGTRRIAGVRGQGGRRRRHSAPRRAALDEAVAGRDANCRHLPRPLRQPAARRRRHRRVLEAARPAGALRRHEPGGAQRGGGGIRCEERRARARPAELARGDAHGRPHSDDGINQPPGGRIAASVVDVGDGTYECTYLARHSGEYELHVLAGGKELGGSHALTVLPAYLRGPPRPPRAAASRPRSREKPAVFHIVVARDALGVPIRTAERLPSMKVRVVHRDDDPRRRGAAAGRRLLAHHQVHVAARGSA